LGSIDTIREVNRFTHVNALLETLSSFRWLPKHCQYVAQVAESHGTGFIAFYGPFFPADVLGMGVGITCPIES